MSELLKNKHKILVIMFQILVVRSKLLENGYKVLVIMSELLENTPSPPRMSLYTVAYLHPVDIAYPCFDIIGCINGFFVYCLVCQV